MKQKDAVILTLETLGGQATLAELNRHVLRVPDCRWATKTPFASIRRIVQTAPEIFRVRPGLWALRSHQQRLGLTEHGVTTRVSADEAQHTHAYYQGLVTIVGRLRGHATFVPDQDQNRLCVKTPLRELRTLQALPPFSYPELVRRSSTVDVIWFNERNMPHSLFEVEHSTDIQNSLIKFCDLRDFHARMVLVADEHRHAECKQKMARSAFAEIRERVSVLGYETLVRQYEAESFNATQDFRL